MSVIVMIAWPIAAVSLAGSLYLACLTVLAPFGRRRAGRRRPVVGGETRFGVLVPAHNEEPVIGRTLDSLAKVDYARELYEVFVIADNCDDETEAIARGRRVHVLVRSDEELRGKGYAIAWALDQLPLSELDAVAFVDADSVVDSGFLQEMSDEIKSGASVVQGRYEVLESGSSVARSLRSISFALVHYVRPLGRSVFGGQCGLKGNGMAISTAVLRDAGWQAFSIVEDSEQSAYLLEKGYKTAFAPDARVFGEMPLTLGGSRSQNLRWESGRVGVAWRWVPRLVRRGLQRRSIVSLEAAVDLLLPPISVIASLALAALAVGALAGRVELMAAAAVALVSLSAHVVGGMIVAKVPVSEWKALLAAPGYLLWKLALYARALTGPGGRSWERTPREQADR